MSKAQAARTFSVSLSSVKRYVNKANQGEPLAPKKSPGSAPKLDCGQEQGGFGRSEALGAALSAVRSEEVRGYFEHAG